MIQGGQKGYIAHMFSSERGASDIKMKAKEGKRVLVSNSHRPAKR